MSTDSTVTTASTVATDSTLAGSTDTTATVISMESGPVSHRFKINGYTHTKILRCYSEVESDSFRAGGHSWRILFFPDGSRVCFELKFTRGYYHRAPDRAIARFTLVPRGGGGEPLTITLTFVPSCLDRDPRVYIERTELERCYVGEDDSLTIECDVRTTTISVVKPHKQRDLRMVVLVSVLLLLFVPCVIWGAKRLGFYY